MQINGKHYRTIWVKEGADPTVQIIDQRKLPHAFVIEDLNTIDDFARAIREMHVRGAPLIGAFTPGAAGCWRLRTSRHRSAPGLGI